MRKPKPQLHWTLERAAQEFRINYRTLTKQLKANAIEPAFEDKTFSTKQITQAVFGDIQGERLRNEKLDADLKEIKKQIALNALVSSDRVQKLWGEIIIASRQLIQNSAIPQELKEDLTTQLAEIPAAQYSKEAPAEEPDPE